jgi:superfamily II DNA helicase RecQ
MRPLSNPKNPIFNVLNTILPDSLDANMRPKDIDKTLLYFNSESACGQGVEVLKKILPPHIRELVFAYSLTISTCGKAAIWDGFKLGQFRIICATDAAGMGCNVPDIKHTVVFGVPKFPKSLLVVVQHWGRTTRDCSMSGTCQMLLPEWVFCPKESNLSKKEPKRNVKQ